MSLPPIEEWDFREGAAPEHQFQVRVALNETTYRPSDLDKSLAHLLDLTTARFKVALKEKLRERVTGSMANEDLVVDVSLSVFPPGVGTGEKGTDMEDTKTTVGEPKWGFGVMLESPHGMIGKVTMIFADHAAMLDVGVVQKDWFGKQLIPGTTKDQIFYCCIIPDDGGSFMIGENDAELAATQAV